MKYWFTYVFCLLALTAGSVVAMNFTQQDCYFTLEENTLRLGNQSIERVFTLNGGVIVSRAIHNKETNKGFEFSVDAASSRFPGGHTVEDIKYRTAWVADEVAHASHMEVSIRYHLGKLVVKEVFRVYQKLPVIGKDIYLKGKSDQDWGAGLNALSVINGDEKALLRAVASDVNTPILEYLPLEGMHYKLRAVRFRDVTDVNNTLVQEDDYLLYTQPLLLSGNLLLVEDLSNQQRLFILKEAPLGDAQAAYPGYDFYAEKGELRVVGAGIQSTDIEPDVWVKAYSVVIGLSEDSELCLLKTLRDYLKDKRPYRPKYDAMIMMNTWGDRGRDARVNESFVLSELEAGHRLGITHFQIDDGWQKGLSKNSVNEAGNLWSLWDADSWSPHPVRFPNGLSPVVERAKELGIELGLWFHPSDADEYANWKQDIDVIIGLYEKYGIRYFKIDGIEIPTKQAEVRLRKFFDSVVEASGGNIRFNLDATVGRRGGYFYLTEYGNVFLENRYTDWGNYYPHWTLRNLWMLSKYVPPENLQIEFLNKWRNAEVYGKGDRYRPYDVPFDYQFAITAMAQPLAWFEGGNLPEEAFATAPLIHTYYSVMHEIHSGRILPIGDEPSGSGWTGFQSIRDENSGYVIIFRELNEGSSALVKTWFSAGEEIKFRQILGHGRDFEALVNRHGEIEFSLPKVHSFSLYKYLVQND